MTPLDLRRGERGVVRVGHRGAAALAPENTLAAIEAAAAVGVDAVELDVLRRDDGVLVLGHGPPGAGGLPSKSGGRVRDPGSPAGPAPGAPADAPSLDAALALAVRLGLAVQVDVKDRGYEAEIVAALREHDLLARSFVSAFSLPILRAFAAVEPGLPRSFTYPEDRLGATERRLLRPAVRPALAVLRALAPLRLPRLLRAAGAQAATLNWAVASPAAVAACHACGAAVFVWTVNEAALATTLVESGIDGIITDDPRILGPCS